MADGNEAMVRKVAEQVAAVAVEQYALLHPTPKPEPKMEIPAPLKWAGAIAMALMTGLALAMAVWMVTTLSGLVQTVTRIDERQQLTGNNTAQRLDKIEDRLSRLEQVKQDQKR